MRNWSRRRVQRAQNEPKIGLLGGLGGARAASLGPLGRFLGPKASRKCDQSTQQSKKRPAEGPQETARDAKRRPKGPPKVPKWGEIGAEDGSKEQFEDRSPKTSNSTTLFSEKLVFARSKGTNFEKKCCKNVMESFKSSNRCKKVVAKELRKAFWSEQSGRDPLRMLLGRYFGAGLPPHLLSKSELQRTKLQERSAKSYVFGV